MFQLTHAEFRLLRSQTVTSRRWGGRRYPPYAFSEQGVAMLSSVLNSSRAIRVNIEIMRAFVRLRLAIPSRKELEQKLSQLERKTESRFTVVFQALRELMSQPKSKRKRIGFHSGQGP